MRYVWLVLELRAAYVIYGSEYKTKVRGEKMMHQCRRVLIIMHNTHPKCTIMNVIIIQTRNSREKMTLVEGQLSAWLDRSI